MGDRYAFLQEDHSYDDDYNSRDEDDWGNYGGNFKKNKKKNKKNKKNRGNYNSYDDDDYDAMYNQSYDDDESSDQEDSRDNENDYRGGSYDNNDRSDADYKRAGNTKYHNQYESEPVKIDLTSQQGSSGVFASRKGSSTSPSDAGYHRNSTVNKNSEYSRESQKPIPFQEIKDNDDDDFDDEVKESKIKAFFASLAVLWKWPFRLIMLPVRGIKRIPSLFYRKKDELWEEEEKENLSDNNTKTQLDDSMDETLKRHSFRRFLSPVFYWNLFRKGMGYCFYPFVWLKSGLLSLRRQKEEDDLEIPEGTDPETAELMRLERLEQKEKEEKERREAEEFAELERLEREEQARKSSGSSARAGVSGTDAADSESDDFEDDVPRASWLSRMFFWRHKSGTEEELPQEYDNQLTKSNQLNRGTSPAIESDSPEEDDFFEPAPRDWRRIIRMTTFVTIVTSVVILSGYTGYLFLFSKKIADQDAENRNIIAKIADNMEKTPTPAAITTDNMESLASNSSGSEALDAAFPQTSDITAALQKEQQITSDIVNSVADSSLEDDLNALIPSSSPPSNLKADTDTAISENSDDSDSLTMMESLTDNNSAGQDTSALDPNGTPETETNSDESLDLLASASNDGTTETSPQTADLLLPDTSSEGNSDSLADGTPVNTDNPDMLNTTAEADSPSSDTSSSTLVAGTPIDIPVTTSIQLADPNSVNTSPDADATAENMPDISIESIASQPISMPEVETSVSASGTEPAANSEENITPVDDGAAALGTFGTGATFGSIAAEESQDNNDSSILSSPDAANSVGNNGDLAAMAQIAPSPAPENDPPLRNSALSTPDLSGSADNYEGSTFNFGSNQEISADSIYSPNTTVPRTSVYSPDSATVENEAETFRAEPENSTFAATTSESGSNMEKAQVIPDNMGTAAGTSTFGSDFQQNLNTLNQSIQHTTNDLSSRVQNFSSQLENGIQSGVDQVNEYQRQITDGINQTNTTVNDQINSFQTQGQELYDTLKNSVSETAGNLQSGMDSIRSGIQNTAQTIQSIPDSLRVGMTDNQSIEAGESTFAMTTPATNSVSTAANGTTGNLSSSAASNSSAISTSDVAAASAGLGTLAGLQALSSSENNNVSNGSSVLTSPQRANSTFPLTNSAATPAVSNQQASSGTPQNATGQPTSSGTVVPNQGNAAVTSQPLNATNSPNTVGTAQSALVENGNSPLSLIPTSSVSTSLSPLGQYSGVNDSLSRSVLVTPGTSGSTMNNQGTSLSVPDNSNSGQVVSSSPLSATASVPQATGSAQPVTDTVKYRVYTTKNGDNLFTIAQNELGDSSRWTEIKQLNNLQSGSSYFDVGTKIYLPDKSE